MAPTAAGNIIPLSSKTPVATIAAKFYPTPQAGQTQIPDIFQHVIQHLNHVKIYLILVKITYY